MGAVGLLAALLLPVPFAQVHLGQLLPMEATASGLLGQLLGILVFLSLRLAQHRRIIKALPIRGSAAQRKESGLHVAADEADGGRYRLHDNLSDFWGGCSWPPQKCRGADEDFVLVPLAVPRLGGARLGKASVDPAC
mmetsp:Transcript_26893/g.47855  ORF Transcript_26893/g.47855 Transcript_26893/m.47855 type:complete len:137 (-) Transcript_26893:79-489(-)